eukprot:TRINITY_DN1409_c0_g1_i1.p1 TRINITY_DN1409_c0_g1~~TRINITY_DN1409_c0_g1_i1.p1  ORF type:complete len:406 (-),score=60.40 TRINITY_DN1409_c0_g1_i1:799-2016(-)
MSSSTEAPLPGVGPASRRVVLHSRMTLPTLVLCSISFLFLFSWANFGPLIFVGFIIWVLSGSKVGIAVFVAVWTTAFVPAGRWEAFCRSAIWRWWADYFRFECVRPDGALDSSSHYLFAIHPHGVFPVGTVLLGAFFHTIFPELKAMPSGPGLPASDGDVSGESAQTGKTDCQTRQAENAAGGTTGSTGDAAGVSSGAANNEARAGAQAAASSQRLCRIRGLVASALANAPVLGLICRFLGAVPATKAHMREGLREGHVFVVPGGIAEVFSMMRYRHTNDEVVFIGHQGFLVEAMRAGVAVVPVFAFGHSMVLHSTYGRLQERLSRLLRFPVLFFYGRFGLPLPHRHRVHLIFGEPVHLPQRAQPTSTEVAAAAAIYTASLRRLYERHRGDFSEYTTRDLRFVTS